MKTKLLAMLLVGGSTLFADTHFSFGINVNPRPAYRYYAPPPPPVFYAPPSPGYGYVWVPGYYVTAGRNRQWRNGYWQQPQRNFRGNGWNNGRGNGRNNRRR